MSGFKIEHSLAILPVLLWAPRLMPVLVSVGIETCIFCSAWLAWHLKFALIHLFVVVQPHGLSLPLHSFSIIRMLASSFVLAGLLSLAQAAVYTVCVITRLSTCCVVILCL